MSRTLYSRLVDFKKRHVKRRLVPEDAASLIDAFFNGVHNVSIISRDRARDLLVDARDIARDSAVQTKDTTRDAAKDLLAKAELVRKPISSALLLAPLFASSLLKAFAGTIGLRKYIVTEESDQEAVRNIRHIIANSDNVSKRIKKYYGRDSVVIYPPAPENIASMPTGNFWLSVNRLTPEKRIGMQVEAFNKLEGMRLIIVGGYDGAHEAYAKEVMRTANKNITFLENLPEAELRGLYAECRGFLATSLDEDFGMAAVEAMAAGKPVIAASEGGYRETMVDGVTGMLIEDISAEKLISAVKDVEVRLAANAGAYRRACTERAEVFSAVRFAHKMREEIDAYEKEKQLIFIVGVPRSGTTWLWGLLTSHEDVEPLLKSDFTGADAGMKDGKYLSVETNMLFDYGLEKIKEAASRKAKKFILEKTPDHLLRIKKIKEAFPSAKIIHVLRNPFAVYSSYKNSDWDRKVDTVEEWLPIYEKRIAAFAEHKDDPDLLTVTYEELHRNTRKALEKIFAHVGLKKPADMAAMIRENRNVSKSLGKHSIRKARTGSWQKELTSEEVASIRESLKKYEFLNEYLDLPIAYRARKILERAWLAIAPKKLVFIVGIPRSGTTWLWTLLSKHRDVDVITEYDFKDKKPQEGSYPLMESNMLFDQPLSKIREVIDGKKARTVVEKTPLHITKLDMIAKEFPDAKIINIFRNPFSVYASYKFTESPDWELKGIEVEEWVRIYKEIFSSFAGRLDRPNILTLSYEEALADTEGTLRLIYRFLGLDTYNISETIRNSSFEKMFPIVHKHRGIDSLKEKLTEKEKEYIRENLKEEIAALEKMKMS